MIPRYFIMLLAFLVLAACKDKQSENADKNAKKGASKTINAKDNSLSLSLAGKYKKIPSEDAQGDCELTVEISKKADDYTYLLKTESREARGRLAVMVTNASEEVISFEDIKWDEYKVNRNSEETDSTKSNETPIGIGGSAKGDTITIQNSGNTKNSYKKISECPDQYLILVKQ